MYSLLFYICTGSHSNENKNKEDSLNEKKSFFAYAEEVMKETGGKKVKVLWEIISSVIFIGILVFGGIAISNPKKVDEIEDKIYEAVEQSASSRTASPLSSYVILTKSETFDDYAKIHWGGCEGAVDDYYWNSLLLQGSLTGIFLDTDELNQYDKKALWDAMRYVRFHETNLINGGLYYITLYKHYYSENDSDGWAVALRYSRREDDFNFAICRF